MGPDSEQENSADESEVVAEEADSEEQNLKIHKQQSQAGKILKV